MELYIYQFLRLITKIILNQVHSHFIKYIQDTLL